jgi:hypothetical protein
VKEGGLLIGHYSQGLGPENLCYNNLDMLAAIAHYLAHLKFHPLKLAVFLFLFAALTFPALTRAATVKDLISDMAPDKTLNMAQYGLNNAESTIVSLGCNALTCLDDDGRPFTIGAVNQAAEGAVFLATKPPVQTSEYIADLFNNTGLVQPAYAQGIGFAGLSPILTIWKAFRNIAYFFFILIFVAVGFMVMFRTQLNPQTVVTVQAALPKMILSLILITFSYAIAGFIVDLIYLSIFAFTAMFETFGILFKDGGAEAARNAIFGRSIWSIGIHTLLGPFAEGGPAGHPAGAAANSIATLIDTSLLGTGALHWLTAPLAYLIVGVALLIAMFRTLFALITAYVGIILQVIFAPIFLLVNALPQANTFSSWIRGLIANAAVFPVVAVMLIIGTYLTASGSNNLGVVETNERGFGYGEGGGFVPPLITSVTENVAQGPQHISAIIGIGIILLMPQLIQTVKESLGVKESFGGAFTGALAAGLAPWRKGVQTAGGIYRSEEEFRKQRRAFGLPEMSPYQRGPIPPSRAQEQRARIEEFLRRLVGF